MGQYRGYRPMGATHQGAKRPAGPTRPSFQTGSQWPLPAIPAKDRRDGTTVTPNPWRPSGRTTGRRASDTRAPIAGSGSPAGRPRDVSWAKQPPVAAPNPQLPVNLKASTEKMVKRVHALDLACVYSFAAAAEHGSFRRAGSLTGVEESTISRRIRDLEHQLGAALFHRRSGGVHLTIAGEHFLPRAQSLLRLAQESVEEIPSIKRQRSGSAIIAFDASLASGFLRELLDVYRRRRTDVRISLVDCMPDDPIEAVRALQVDAAFIAGDEARRDCCAEHLWSEGLFAAFPEHHHLTHLPEVTWEDLQGETFLFGRAVVSRRW